MQLLQIAYLTAVCAAQQVVLSQPQPVDGPLDLSNRVFAGLNGLFKSWNQAYAPVGRALLPVTIPKGVNLYHGRPYGTPEGVEWFAMDDAHAYMFAFGDNATLWTFTTTREIRALAFDGFSCVCTAALGPLFTLDSAAKATDGTLDQQEVLAYGSTRQAPHALAPPTNPKIPGAVVRDTEMIQKLCDMYSSYGIVGFVREEATFELAACDVGSSDYRVIHAVNSSFLASPVDPDDPYELPAPGRRYVRNDDAYLAAHRWSFYRAAAAHHHVPERRAHPHPAHLVTLYDEGNYPSLAESNRLSIYDHRLTNMSTGDVKTWRKEIEQALQDWTDGISSGVDWIATAQAVFDRYFYALGELQVVLANRTNASHTIERVDTLAYATLLPYIEGFTISTWPTPTNAEARAAALERSRHACVNAYTGHINPYSMNRQEQRLSAAIKGVLQRICPTFIDMLQEALVLLEDEPTPSSKQQKAAVERWSQRLEVLLTWLAWPEFQRCDNQCGFDEVCAIDMWPALISPGTDRHPPHPQPRCLNFEQAVELQRRRRERYDHRGVGRRPRDSQ